jgi:hypothetical protein
MLAGTQERRRSTRVAAAHAVVVRDLEDNVLASERGAFALTNSHAELRAGQEVLVELSIPALAPTRRQDRTVTYRCRIARLGAATITGPPPPYLNGSWPSPYSRH